MFTWRKIIPPKRNLTCGEVRSHLGRKNPFSYKQFVFTKWNTPFCRDLARVRRLTWVGWFFSYKQLLGSLVKQSNEIWNNTTNWWRRHKKLLKSLFDFWVVFDNHISGTTEEKWLGAVFICMPYMDDRQICLVNSIFYGLIFMDSD